MATMSTGSQDVLYTALLGLAETFRKSNPPKIRQCIQCLQSILHFQPSPAIQSRIHFQLGRLLLAHTMNIDMARSHLEKSIVQVQALGAGLEETHLEATCLLTDIYKEQGLLNLAKSTLRQGLEVAHANNMPYWQFKITFLLADIHACDKEQKAAAEVLGMGERFAEHYGSHYMKCLFSLSRALAFMMMKDVNHASGILTMTSGLLERWQVSTYQRESLQVFCLLLKVWSHLSTGQSRERLLAVTLTGFLFHQRERKSSSESSEVTELTGDLLAKSARSHLKQLQQSIQILTSLHMDESQIHEAERFEWLSKEHLCVLVYLVTVMHSMYSGYLVKAVKYSEKALAQVERLKSSTSNRGLLSTFHLVLLEHIILCRIVQGQMPQAIKEISQVYQIAQHDDRLITTHRSVLHTLLGLYAMSMNLMDQAAAQFNAALETCGQPELRNFIGLNLAIIYIRARAGGSKMMELENLLTNIIRPDLLPTSSHSLQAGSYYIRGLLSFFESHFMDAKKYLRETLKIANSEDLNRLTACSLVLLGHTFLAQGITQEALDMALPANQLTSKIPDTYIQMWAASLLRDLYGLLGDPVSASEHYQLHNSLTKLLFESHMQASQMPEHRLIEWVGAISPPRPSSHHQTGLLTSLSPAGPSSMA